MSGVCANEHAGLIHLAPNLQSIAWENMQLFPFVQFLPYLHAVFFCLFFMYFMINYLWMSEMAKFSRACKSISARSSINCLLIFSLYLWKRANLRKRCICSWMRMIKSTIRPLYCQKCFHHYLVQAVPYLQGILGWIKRHFSPKVQ